MFAIRNILEVIKIVIIQKRSQIGVIAHSIEFSRSKHNFWQCLTAHWHPLTLSVVGVGPTS